MTTPTWATMDIDTVALRTAAIRLADEFRHLFQP